MSESITQADIERCIRIATSMGRTLLEQATHNTAMAARCLRLAMQHDSHRLVPSPLEQAANELRNADRFLRAHRARS